MLVPEKDKAKIRTKNKVKTIKYEIEDKYKKLGLGKKYYIKTYGCQMNVHDTENIKAILDQMGFKECEEMEKADLILLNTCAIRENAHNKVFGMIGRIKHMKEERPNIIAGICGCMAQEEGVVNEILTKYKWLDIVFGTHNIHELPFVLDKALKSNSLEVKAKT